MFSCLREVSSGLVLCWVMLTFSTSESLLLRLSRSSCSLTISCSYSSVSFLSSKITSSLVSSLLKMESSWARVVSYLYTVRWSRALSCLRESSNLSSFGLPIADLIYEWISWLNFVYLCWLLSKNISDAKVMRLRIPFNFSWSMDISLSSHVITWYDYLVAFLRRGISPRRPASSLNRLSLALSSSILRVSAIWSSSYST